MTPRRIVLTIVGLLLFGTAYSVYDRFLGWIDGLPLLPARMLAASDSSFRVPTRYTSPTIERLKEAFGENSMEKETAFYPTQLEFRNGETSTVVAAGRPPSNPRSKQVPLSPFSVAVFSKPRPEHLRQPGEVNEITTFHSDKAVLEFDREIKTPTDMNSAKLIGLELISDPERTLPDPRMGLVHITNNQRSSDPNRRMLLKTVGPVFYRDLKAVGTRYNLTERAFADLKKAKVSEGVLGKLAPLKNQEFSREEFVAQLLRVLSSEEIRQFQNVILDLATVPGKQSQFGPDMWTDAAIEAIDHSNIPHRAGTAATTAPTVSEEVRNPTAIADILTGQRLPPPTVTGVGMRIYLSSEEHGKPQAKKGSGGFSGLRRIELLEQVTMHLWMEGGQGLVGSEGKSSITPESPPAAASVAGGLIPALDTIRQLSRDLLQIETRGPFSYDAEKNLARFDVLPQADPNLTNDVRATKIPPRPAIETLFSQVLELEFYGSSTDTPEQQPAKPAKPTSTAAAPGKEKPAGGGPQFKRLHAWTYTPGRFLTISSDADQLEAYGQDLVREQETETTRLTGTPLFAVKERSTLTAGGPSTSGVLISEPCPGAKGPERHTIIQGPGQIKLYDPAAKTNTLAVAWQTSMVQTKELIGDRELDVYTFTDAVKMEDLQSDYWLKGKEIKLWVIPSGSSEAGAPKAAASSGPASRSLLHRLVAVGDVTGHSTDLDIDHTDRLIALFQDVTPSEPGVPNPMAPGKNDAVTQPKEPVNPNVPLSPPMVPDAAPPPKEPEKPKPPMKIKARTIDAWVYRYPLPKPPGAPNTPPPPPTPGENASPGGGGMKYELERAVCEGMVFAHQDPDDPAKERGTDIIGSRLLINNTLGNPNGSRLTVYGWGDYKVAEVHNEGTSLIGPMVLIDQLHNLAIIEGRGSLVLPANSDLTGADLKKSDADPKKQQQQNNGPVIIHFRDKMEFWGTDKLAVFTGKVNASQITPQSRSWIVCDLMKVNLDRPVYFSQANRPGGPSKPANNSPLRSNSQPPAKGPNGQPAPGPNNPDEDKPKIDVIYCYPAPADTADNQKERLNENVVFTQIDYDPETGKPIRRQQLTAQELTIRAQVKDESRGEPYRMVLAYGPGVTRIWAPESKEDDDAKSGSAKPPANAKPSPPAENVMKLTVIYFSGRMTAKDKGEVYKEATFLDNIHVFNFATDNPDVPIEKHKLPLDTLKLDCTDRLMVWSHKNVRLPDEPATQYMHAYGNAFLQNPEYDGWGEVIRSEGKMVYFDGTGLVPARIKSRIKGNDNAGQQIRLDRTSDKVTVVKSLGGMLIDGDIDDSKSTTNPNNPNPPNSNNPSSNNNKQGTTPNKN